MSRDIQTIVERQIAKWRLQERIAKRRRQPHHERPRANVVALCYAPGIDGNRLAGKIARRLRLPHFDHEIVEHIASTAEVHVKTVESLDEHVQGRIDEYLTSLIHERNFDRSDYLRLLGRTVVALSEHGPCVLSGHGAVHLVPRLHALVLRLTAPFGVRAAQLARQRGLDVAEARRELHRADAEQEAYHHRFFHAYVDDPANYDLVVDTSRLAPHQVAELVSLAYKLRFVPRPQGLRGDIPETDQSWDEPKAS